jgi:hypothetical protein
VGGVGYSPFAVDFGRQWACSCVQPLVRSRWTGPYLDYAVHDVDQVI